MGMAINRGGLRNATSSDYCNKAILLDVTYAYQSVGHIRAGSADRDGLAASESEAHKRSHYARSSEVSFDERSYRLVTHAVEGFGRLDQEGSDPMNQATATVVGGTDIESLARKCVCNERRLQKRLE